MGAVLVDVCVNGAPRDLTGSRWHAPIRTADGRPLAAYDVTVTTPPDAQTPCRLRLEAPDVDLPAGCVVTLEQTQPERYTWWAGPVPESLQLETDTGDVLADEHDEPLDWAEVLVLDRQPTGCTVRTTRDPRSRDVRPFARTGEHARHAFRDLTDYERITPGPGRDQRRRERLHDVHDAFPSTIADAAEWLADDHAFGRLARDLVIEGLTEPGAMGPRKNPVPADCRREWKRLCDAATADHEPEPVTAPEPSPTPPLEPQPPRAPTRRRPTANCENCARAGHTARSQYVDPTTVNGRLEVAARLCGWCYKRVVSTGVLPSAEDVTAHARGRRLPRSSTATSVWYLTVTRDDAMRILTAGFTADVTLERTATPPADGEVTLKIELPPDGELRGLLGLPTSRFMAGNEQFVYGDGLAVTAALLNEHAVTVTPTDP